MRSPGDGRVDGFPRRFADAAWRLGSARGYAGLTVRALADEMKVSVGLLYVHFEDKAALMRAVHRVAGERLDAQLDAKAEMDGDSSSLAAICRRYVAFVHEHLWIYENDLAPLGSAVDLPHRDAFIEHARRRSRAEVPDSTWLHLWIGIHGLAMLTRRERPQQVETIVGEHVSLWLRALALRAT